MQKPSSFSWNSAVNVGVVWVLRQVKRVLRSGGKYACVTAAHNNVLGYSQKIIAFISSDLCPAYIWYA